VGKRPVLSRKPGNEAEIGSTSRAFTRVKLDTNLLWGYVIRELNRADQEPGEKKLVSNRVVSPKRKSGARWRKHSDVGRFQLMLINFRITHGSNSGVGGERKERRMRLGTEAREAYRRKGKGAPSYH